MTLMELKSGEKGPEFAEADSSRANESVASSRISGTDVSRDVRDPIVKEDVPITVAVEEVGSMQVQNPSPVRVSTAEAPAIVKKTDSHVIEVPVKDSAKVQELDGYKGFQIPRTTSNVSVESATGDLCRICQQHSEEPVMELGCRCRGDVAKAHRSCIEQWFGTKGTNKCEVCQHVATNVPAPSSQPAPHFSVWRVGGGTYNNGGGHRRAGGVGPLPSYPTLLGHYDVKVASYYYAALAAFICFHGVPLRGCHRLSFNWLLPCLLAFFLPRLHPIWAALLFAGLLFDVLISIFLGASVRPLNIFCGILLLMGLSSAAIIILEDWHERVKRRNMIRRLQELLLDDYPAEQSTINIHTAPSQSTSTLTVPVSPQTPAI